MASGEIFGSTSNQDITCRIVWSSVADPKTNTSHLNLSLQYKRTNTGFETFGRGTFSLWIDDEEVTEVVESYVEIVYGVWTEALSYSLDIAHNDDGTKQIKVDAYGNLPNSTLKGTDCGGYINLETIPRESTIISASDVVLGSPCNVKWIPKSKNLYYQLSFSLGDWMGLSGYDGINPNATSLYTYTEYTIPLEVANQLPNSKVGTMTVTLRTFLDSDLANQIGEASTATFTVTVPDNELTKPTVTLEIEPVSDLAAPFNSWYIQGKSGVIATKFAVSGKYNADTVEDSYRMYVEDTGYRDPFQSTYLTTSGYITVTGVATDSRGYVGETTKTINVIPYRKPKILPTSDEGAVICARWKDGNYDESGTQLKIKARRDYERVIFAGEQRNVCVLKCRYRPESQKSFGEWIILLDGNKVGDDAYTDTFDDVVSDVELKADTSYVVQVVVVDTIGESAVIQFFVPTDFVILDIPNSKEGKRIGLFRYAKDDSEPGIDVGAPIHGGSVDNLTLGEVLTASAEAKISLNDVRTPGCYYSPDGENTANIINAPKGVDGGFGLEVREMQSKVNIRQTLYYGITTWRRHFNGTSWSAWVSSLMGVSDEVTALDFVVNSGVSGLWNYRLWKSGNAELWGVITLDTYVDVSRIKKDAGLPFSFIAYPTVSMTLSRATGAGYLQGAIVLSEVYEIGANVITLQMIRGSGGLVDGNTANVHVLINGKWK